MKNQGSVAPRNPFTPTKILTATDFSETAKHGVSAAARLASRSGATLHIVHAVDLAYTSTTIGLTTELLDGMRATAQEKLEKSLEDVRTADLDVQLHLRNGRAADAILDVADVIDADLIVFATHGRHGLAHALLGSTAEHVLQRTARPVLTLHQADGLPDSPPKRILIPTDLSGDAILARAGAERLLGATAEGTEIVLLHVAENPGDYGHNVAAESWTRMLARLRAAAEESLEEIAERIRADGFTVDARVRLGSPSNVIIDEVLLLEPDAICMRTTERGAIGRLFLGSTARRIVQRADCPVLTIRWSETE